MGNQCPECETPIGQCKARDVFKEQPKNRDDLDLSHIKKGEYKKKTSKEIDNSAISIGINFGESVIIEQPLKKQTKKSPPAIKEDSQASRTEHNIKPLSIAAAIQSIELKKGVHYSGPTVDRQPHQGGKVVWEDGAKLNGQFFLGQLVENQKVYMEMPNGSVYDGMAAEGRANGKGKLSFPNGTFIEGTWQNDEPNGFCKHKMADNSFYEGNFVKGVKSGKGKLYFDEGMYEGLFDKDQFHGEGILILNDGRSIRGIWKHGLLQGKAEMEWQTGEKYVGDFEGGLREGSGTYYFNDSREWTGEWANDMQNGFGCFQVKGQMIKSVWISGIKKDQIREVDMNRV